MALDSKDLRRRVDIILKQATLGSPFSSRGGKMFSGGSATNYPLYPPGTPVTDSEPLRLLRLTIAGLKGTDRHLVIGLLWAVATPPTAPTVIQAILYLHALDTFPGSPTTETVAGLLDGIKERLIHDSGTLTPKDLDDIRTLVLVGRSRITAEGLGQASPERRIHFSAHAIAELLDLVDYYRLRQELFEGDNPEINSDRVLLVSRYHDLGFTGVLDEALEKIDSSFLTAADVFDFKTVIDLVRSCLEEIATAAATLDATTLGIDPNLGNRAAKFARCRTTLTRTGLLSEIEDQMLGAFYGFLSVEGAHHLGSAREQARFSKNTMIELGALILTRVRVKAVT